MFKVISIRGKKNWQANYELYKRYKEQHNKDPKQDEQVEGVNLGKWISTQRESYKRETLEQSKINRLNQVGFVWNKNKVIYISRKKRSFMYLDKTGESNINIF